MLFMKEKQVASFLVLKDHNSSWHLSKIARQSGTTYVYVTKLMYVLEKKGLVSMETKGKKRVVTLTEKGLKLANLLEEAKTQIL
ncbi:MAG: hypothetical protein WC488_01895 [Candidatus Micrarchaeia archaeon]